LVFAWFAEHRRAGMREQPFPERWLAYLEKNVGHYPYLSESEQAILRDDLRILIAEKTWEGGGGLELTEEMQVTIAAEASLLLLGLDHEYYPNVESIIVYPRDYTAPSKSQDPSGVIDESGSSRLGEAWNIGPVLVSWADARDGGRNPTDGHNVVLHEFAHKLDMRDGAADGVPKLETDAQYDTWAEVMSAEYQELVAQTEKGHKSLLDSYGATNAAEFFAVATECFFEKSVLMAEQHPRLYAVLRDFYHQDTAARMHAHHSASGTANE
jgi:Mlc titration factor MtfA (ptsG expression regulator)